MPEVDFLSGLSYQSVHGVVSGWTTVNSVLESKTVLGDDGLLALGDPSADADDSCVVACPSDEVSFTGARSLSLETELAEGFSAGVAEAPDSVFLT